jgi:zinc/manganese transport system substrate-binding protein
VTARFLSAAALAAALLLPQAASAKVRVAASINDLASIASSVGGDRVEVFAIARPTADAHRIEALPSYMVRVSRADVYLKVGLGLDRWADAIIDGSRNSRLRIVDCSQGIEVLEKPSGRVDASMGDVHPDGNPHYWLDPRNGAVLARTIAAALAAVDPGHADEYRESAEAFARQAEEAHREDLRLASELPNRALFTYHRSWSYFGNAFGLAILGTVEPVPGIPPTGKHLASLVQIAKSRGVPVLLQEPYFSGEAGRFLARESGVRAVVASPSCDSPRAGSYLEHIRRVLEAVASAQPMGALEADRR